MSRPKTHLAQAVGRKRCAQETANVDVERCRPCDHNRACPLFAISMPSAAFHWRLSMSSNQTPPPRSFISLKLATTSCTFARGEVLAHGSTRPTRSGQRNQVESETQPTETFMLKPFRDSSNRAILDSRQIVHFVGEQAPFFAGEGYVARPGQFH